MFQFHDILLSKQSLDIVGGVYKSGAAYKNDILLSIDGEFAQGRLALSLRAAEYHE